MNQTEILNAAVAAASNGNNPFKGFEGSFQFNSPEPYLDLIRITSEYLNPAIKPFTTGEQRKIWLQERLEMFRIKYLVMI